MQWTTQPHRPGEIGRSLRDGSHYRRSAGLVPLIGALLSATKTMALATTIGSPVLIGSVANPSPPAISLLSEISGIVDSRANADTFWVHNDKGDSARFFAISHSGSLLGAFPLAGAPSGDWEDIAIGPKPGGGSYLYLGDVGDNDSNRVSGITVYRTDEPQQTAGVTIAADDYTALHLKFPGHPRDVESLFVDPLSGDMFLITKRTAIPEIYSVPSAAFDTPGQTATLTSWGNLGGLMRTPTAADISPDGRFILVRSSKSSVGYLYERGIGQSVADALHGDGVPFALGFESQGEGIGWAADGRSFYTTSESDDLPASPIHSYAFTAPEPASWLLAVFGLVSFVTRRHG